MCKGKQQMKFWKLASAVTALVLSTSTNAALLERLGGLAYYDDVADLTWLTNANAVGTGMNWQDANSWAADLTVDGVDGWRLPDSGTCIGYNCTDSEMGNLFYNVLGNTSGGSIHNKGPFNFNLYQASNPNNSRYWTATQHEDILTNAWSFSMGLGEQSPSGQSFGFRAWAVQSGDVSAVPVPAALWLFGSGLIGLAGFARRKRA